MADKVKITDADGNDVEIATDDAGASGQVQIVKIGYSADGVATAVPADANGLTIKQANAALLQMRAMGIDLHDDPVTARPVRVAGTYRTNPPKVSADGDVGNLNLTQDGKILDIHSAPRAATRYVNESYGSAQSNHAFTNGGAPGANKELVVVEIIFTKAAAGTMSLVADPGGANTTVLGPHNFPDNGGMVATRMSLPIGVNKALGITTTGSGNSAITLRAIIEEV